MLYGNREKFEDISEEIGRIFSRLGLSPNQWTVLSFLPALAGFFLVYINVLLGAAVLYSLSFFIDVVDGAVARFTGRTSKRGAYIDTIADRYVEFIFLLSMVFVELPRFLVPAKVWIVLILFGSLITTYAKSAAKEKRITWREIKGGLLERAERVILLVVALLLGVFNRLWMVVLLSALAFLTNISAFQRIYKALKVSRWPKLNK